MAKMTLTLPDELAELVRAQLPGLVYSTVLQDALRAKLECCHHRLACAECGAKLDRASTTAAALSAFYQELADGLAELVVRGGTLEGAARVAKSIAVRAGVKVEGPLPRRTRAERQTRNRIPFYERRTA